MNNIQTQLNIELTNHLSEVFRNNSSKIIWSVAVIDELNPDEDQFTGKVKININGIDNVKLPFVISEQQAIDLGGPVSKLAPENDYLFHCICDVVTHESIELETRIDENLKNVSIKQLNNSFDSNNGSDFYVQPNAVESGGMPYREPLMRFNIVEKLIQQSASDYLKDKTNIEEFSIQLPKEQTFINPQDQKAISNLVESIHSGIAVSTKLRSIISQISDQTLSKKPTEDDQPHIKQVCDILVEGIETIEDYVSSNQLFIKISKIRSPQIKRMLGLNANSYFSPIDEIITRFKGHVTSYTSLQGARNDELQDKHIEACQTFITNLLLLEKTLTDLSEAYETAIV